MDTQDDYFRIRLVCTLLDACGQYFDRGQLRKRLDSFLTFFQMYVRTKRQPLPMDVDFMLTDTLEVSFKQRFHRCTDADDYMQTIRPKFAIITDYEAAAKAVDDMFAVAAQQGQAADSTVTGDAEASDGEDDARSRAELQPRLSGDEVVVAEANGADSSETDEVGCHLIMVSSDRTDLSLNRRARALMRRHRPQRNQAMTTRMRKTGKSTTPSTKSKMNSTESLRV